MSSQAQLVPEYIEFYGNLTFEEIFKKFVDARGGPSKTFEMQYGIREGNLGVWLSGGQVPDESVIIGIYSRFSGTERAATIEELNEMCTYYTRRRGWSEAPSVKFNPDVPRDLKALRITS